MERLAGLASSESDDEDLVQARSRSQSSSPARQRRGQSYNDAHTLERKLGRRRASHTHTHTIYCNFTCISVTVVSENYHLKSKKGQRDERYKQRLKLKNKEKYKQRISRSTIRAKVSYWRKQLQEDLRARKKLQQSCQEAKVIK